MVLKKTLESEGYHVEVATNGVEALEMTKAALPDMIISDLLMPGMDGFRLCQEIRSNPPLKKVPFVFYTSTVLNQKEQQLALSMGVTRCIKRPLETTAFLKIINETIQENKNGTCVNPERPEESEKTSIPKKIKGEIDTFHLYKDIFSNSKDAVAIVNQNGYYLEQNPSHRTLFQYSDDALRGKTPAIHFGEKSFSGIFKQLTEKGVYRGELASRTRSGKTINVELLAFPIFDHNGKVTSYVGINRDISPSKETEKQLRQKQNLETIAQLADGVAHEFNNLLTPIIGYVDILMRQTSKQPKDQDILSMIQKAAQYGADLTKKLLSFSRQLPGTLKPQSLLDLTLEIEHLLRQTIDRAIELTVESSDDLWPVLIDTDQIHQVIVELCTNSLDTLKECMLKRRDFQPAIKIKLNNVHLDQAFCTSHPDAKTGDFVCLSVIDNGAGIDKLALPHLFEPFFTTKGLSQGTGLALAASHGIIESHEGWIGVKTAKDRGTTFEVYLPRTERPAVVEVQEIKNHPNTQNSATIMIVDDDELVRSLGEAVLEGRGYSVLLAGDGEQALKIFKQRREAIDLVILDLTMPGKSGWEVLSDLRLLDPGIKAIISTGHTISDQTKEAKEMQPITILSKPYKPSDMERMVQKVLEQGRNSKDQRHPSGSDSIKPIEDIKQEINLTKHKERRSEFQYRMLKDRRYSNNQIFRGDERRSSTERRQGLNRRHIEKCREV